MNQTRIALLGLSVAALLGSLLVLPLLIARRRAPAVIKVWAEKAKGR